MPISVNNVCLNSNGDQQNIFIIKSANPHKQSHYKYYYYSRVSAIMNIFLKFHLTFTVAVLFFFNSAIAKEASIRALAISPEKIIRPPIEISPGMVTPTVLTKPPVRPIAVQPRPTAAPAKPTIVPLKPTRAPTKPTIKPTTRKPTFPIKVPTRKPFQRFPSIVVEPFRVPLD